MPGSQPEGWGGKGFTTLAAVTANGNGTAVPLGRARHLHAMQVVTTGSPSGGTVTLQGSLNGSNWFTTGAVFTIGTDTSGDIKWATDKPVLHLRTVLAGLTGGTAPTVTATVTSV